MKHTLLSPNHPSTTSAKSPWNTHTVLGIFYPCPFFMAEMTIVSPHPPLYNVEAIAEALRYLERHHFSLQCYSYHLQTTLLYGEGNFVARLQHKSEEVFQDCWQTLQADLCKQCTSLVTIFLQKRPVPDVVYKNLL